MSIFIEKNIYIVIFFTIYIKYRYFIIIYYIRTPTKRRLEEPLQAFATTLGDNQVPNPAPAELFFRVAYFHILANIVITIKKDRIFMFIKIAVLKEKHDKIQYSL